MRTHLIFGFLLAALCLSAHPAASAGLAMAKGLPPQTAASVLAERIDHALALDPRGNAVIGGTACTTPRMFFEAIRARHPSARLESVQELPAYLRTLVRKKAPKDAYRLARIIQHDKTCRLDLEGWSRKFFPNEDAWYDPNTGEAILAGDCGNIVGERKTAVANPCVEISFNAPVGSKVRWGVGTATGPLPPSACNAMRQGRGPWVAWLGECDVCQPAVNYIRAVFGKAAEIPHKYLYVVSSPRQVLRFPTAVWQRLVYLCLQYPDGTDTCGVYIRPQDWRGRHEVEIPDALWRRNAGNCPQ